MLSRAPPGQRPLALVPCDLAVAALHRPVERGWRLDLLVPASERRARARRYALHTPRAVRLRACAQHVARSRRPPGKAGVRAGRQRVAHLARGWRRCARARGACSRRRLTPLLAGAPHDLTKENSQSAPLRDVAGGAPRVGARVRVLRLTLAWPRAVLDSSAQILFLTEMFRGMSLTLKYFFEPKVTVRRCSQNALAFARLAAAH